MYIEEEKKHDEEALNISPDVYQQRIQDDDVYIARHPKLSSILTRKWESVIYQTKFPNLPASALVHGIFAHRRQDDDMIFAEHLSKHMESSD